MGAGLEIPCDNTATFQEDKVKFNMYKEMTEKKIDGEGLGEDENRKYNAVKGLYTGGLKKEPNSDAVSNKGRSFTGELRVLYTSFCLMIQQGLMWVGYGQLKALRNN